MRQEMKEKRKRKGESEEERKGGRKEGIVKLFRFIASS